MVAFIPVRFALITLTLFDGSVLPAVIFGLTMRGN